MTTDNENIDNDNDDLVSLIQLAVDNQPGEFAAAVGAELTSRVFDRLTAHREEISSQIFGGDKE